MKVFYSTPWRTGDIGGGINDFIAAVPTDSWICVRDGDTLFLTADWGAQIEQIIARHGANYAVIGAMTNRVRSPYQLHGGVISDNGDISHHCAIASDRWATYGTSVRDIPGPLAGMCLIFNRRVWERTPFEPRSIYFDKLFSSAVRKAGGRLGVAQGLYLFHLYRWGSADPINNVEHLQ
jgi:hypothetical protein